MASLNTAAKVFLGIGCVLLVVVSTALVTCAGCMAALVRNPTTRSAPISTPSSAPMTPAEDASFRRVGSQGMMDFVVASKELSRNHAALEHRVRNFCSLRHSDTGFCWILVWSRESLVPKNIPMSDRQANAMVASYNRNPNTGHDCFQLVRKGTGYYHSGECGPYADSPSDPRHDPIP
jgi:hypothetical protein